MTAAPSLAKSRICCLIEEAAAASTPHVGWFTIKIFGFCINSRPITNFCKLPPDNDLARASDPLVRTSNFFIISSDSFFELS